MAEPSFNLAGKVAIVTGGARGIGFGTAQALSRRGAAAMIVDLDQKAAQSAAAQVGGGARGFAADVTDRGAMQRVVATVVQERGGVDVVVANAGVATRGATVRAMNDEVFDRVLAVNLGGVYNTVSAGLEQITQHGGHIVVTSSVYAFLNGAGLAPYAIAKAGVEQLGRALRIELAPHGASAGVAYFGFIDTEMVHRTIDSDPHFRAYEQGHAGVPAQAPVARAGRRGGCPGDRETGAADHRAQALDRPQRAAGNHQPAPRRPDGQGRCHAGADRRARFSRR